MPARKVYFVPGHYYHIYNRGAGRQLIFRESDNYIFVLRRIKEHASSLNVTIIAYCLMPNHYHFLLRQNGNEPAGLLPQWVFNSYTKAFNKRYSRSGTLFEGRYQAIHVDKHEYLVHLCRYIHANPVKAGLVSQIEQWPYSNYHEWLGTRRGTLVDPAFVQEHFLQVQLYQEFVQSYLTGLESLPAGIEPYLLVS